MRKLAAGLALVCILTGCAAEPIAPQPTITPTVPDGGISLIDAGFEHGPVGFSVPRGLVVRHKVDQANVVTIVVDAHDGTAIESYLREHLDDMGFHVEGDVPGSLYFRSDGWEGAYTTGGDQAGLTLRKDPGSFESTG